MEWANEAFFPYSKRCYDHCKMFFTHFHSSSYLETYSFIKIMQPISPNYNWKNGVKQIKITEENLSQSCTFCQLLRTKTLASRSKCIKHFFLFLPLFALYLLSGWANVIHLKSTWWLVWIFIPLTWKIKLRK